MTTGPVRRTSIGLPIAAAFAAGCLGWCGVSIGSEPSAWAEGPPDPAGQHDKPRPAATTSIEPGLGPADRCRPLGPTAAALVQRLEALGYRLDLGAYPGLPESLLVDDLNYLLAAAELVGGRQQVERSEHALLSNFAADPQPGFRRAKAPGNERVDEWEPNDPEYPFEVVSARLPVRPLPLKLLPAPERVREVLAGASTPDGPLLELSIERLVELGFRLGYATYFVAAPDVTEPRFVPPLPADTDRVPPPGGHWAGPLLGRYVRAGEDYQRLYHTPPKHADALRTGRFAGTTPLGRVRTIGLTPDIYLREIEREGHAPERSLVYSIADAAGGRRTLQQVRQRGPGVSFFQNALDSPEHDPRLGVHSLLIVPRALPVPYRSSKDWTIDDPVHPQERIVLDEFFSRQDPPIAVLRKSGTWEPFKEDYILDRRLSFDGPDADTARLVCVFTSIEPEALLRVVGALHGREVDDVLADPEAMRRLEDLRPTPRQ